MNNIRENNNNKIIYTSDEEEDEVVECTPSPSPAPQALVKRRRMDPCAEELEKLRRDAVALLVRGDSFEEEVNSSGGVAINPTLKMKFVDVKDCPVYVYAPPRMDPWQALLAKAESNTNFMKLNSLPRGLAFRITQARSVMSTKFDSKNICVTLNDVCDVYLPNRMTADVEGMGLDVFLQGRPYLIYIGVNPVNKAHVPLLIPEMELRKKETWVKIKQIFCKYEINI
ncbi:hypothetical protein R5R35_014088 [Gryllus longicercus]|uniref:Uncharacterized protein n=1 Tax=Gryllus longicercus TaxID=2509291 RepID=A0AAN9VT42_9ORTH